MLWTTFVTPCLGGYCPITTPGAFSGNLTIDISTSTVLEANLSVQNFVVGPSFSTSMTYGLTNLLVTPNGAPSGVLIYLDVNLLDGTLAGGGPQIGPTNTGVSPYVFDMQGTLTLESVSTTPLPDSLPLFATGLGLIGMLGWWRKRKMMIT